MADLFERAISIVREGTLPVMVPLILCSAGIWFLVVERWAYLYDGGFLTMIWPPRRQRIRDAKQRVHEQLEDYIAAPNPGKRTRLLQACGEHRSSYHSFIRRALGWSGSRPKVGLDIRLKESVLNEELRIERGLQILSTLAKVAPLLGLLGTVTGMIQTFQTMMFASTSDPRALSAGISIALIATEVGLVVSIPGVVGMSWLSRRAQTLQEEIRLLAVRLQQTLCNPADKGVTAAAA